MNLRVALHLAGCALLLGAAGLVPVDDLNRAGSDRMARVVQGSPTGSVVVVAIDDLTIAALGPWPWDRSQTARLFEVVALLNPSVVAFDGWFPSRPVPLRGDSVLKSTLARLREEGTRIVLPFQFIGLTNVAPSGSAEPLPDKLVLSSYQLLIDRPLLNASPFLHAEAVLSNTAVLQSSSLPSGHISSAADPSDGFLRRTLHVVRLGDLYFPSFAVALVAAHLGSGLADVSLAPGIVRIKDVEIPIDLEGTSPLLWLGGPGTLPTIPAHQIMADPEQFRAQVEGKIALIGVTSSAALARESGDFFHTPVGVRFPGVEIHGVAVENALSGDVPMRPPGTRALEWLVAMVGCAGAATLTLRQVRTRIWLPVLVLGGLLGWVGLQLIVHVPLALDLPVLATALASLGTFWIRPSVSIASAANLPAPSPVGIPSITPNDGVARIGRYQLIKELGRGAMGVVWKGRDPDLERFVAIKVILGSRRLGDGQDETLERFRREARAIAALNHPNIVTIYESASWEGQPYIAMEFLEGRPLDEVIPRGGYGWAHVRAWGAQIMDGLHCAHGAGVVHRDIKPANVMLVAGGTKAVLTDFGLARRQDSSLTQEGTALGTPYYMAPEQVDGRGTDARSDQFSTGVLLWELCTGRRPWESDDIRSIMLSILLHPAPDIVPLLNPGIPSDVANVLAVMMFKDAAHRFPDLQAARNAWLSLPGA